MENKKRLAVGIAKPLITERERDYENSGSNKLVRDVDQHFRPRLQLQFFAALNCE